MSHILLRTFKRIRWELSRKKLMHAFELVQILSRNLLISSVSAESRLSTLASGVVNPSTSFEQGLHAMQIFAGTSSQRRTWARPEWPEGEGSVCAISQRALNYKDEVIRARARMGGQEV